MTESVAAARVRAQALIEVGRYDEAAAVVRDGLSAAPHDPDLTLLLAICLCEGSASRTDAITAAQRAVALQPNSADAYGVLGWALNTHGKFAQAVGPLEHAVSLDPHDADMHARLAEVLLRQVPPAWGIFSERREELIGRAEQHAADAVRVQPANPAGHLSMAMAKLSREDPFAAEPWIRQALALAPTNPAGHELLGLAAELRGDTASASGHFVDAGKLDPSSSRAVQQLQSMRSRLPLGILVAIGIYWGLKILLRAAGIGGPVTWLVLLLGMVAYLVFSQVWPRLHARLTMSPEARQLLHRHRQLRR